MQLKRKKKPAGKPHSAKPLSLRVVSWSQRGFVCWKPLLVSAAAKLGWKQSNLPRLFLGLRKPSRELMSIFSPIRPNALGWVFFFFNFTFCAPNLQWRWEKVTDWKQSTLLCFIASCCPWHANTWSLDLPSSVHNWTYCSRWEPRCSNWYHKPSAAAPC